MTRDITLCRTELLMQFADRSMLGHYLEYKEHLTYRVIQEESAIFWEMIVCVILSKKVHMNMGPILNCYRDMVKRRYGPPSSTNSNYLHLCIEVGGGIFEHLL